MAHELEILTAITAEGDRIELASFAFEGARKNIWHRLGQQFDGVGLMTAQDAMRLAHMDRNIRIEPLALPDGVQWAQGIDVPSIVVLEGKMFITPEGGFGEIPDKAVGMAGSQASQGHSGLSVEDRFLLAEEAIHASHGEAVWSTAGYLRDGTQGFACMEAPSIIVDPNGVADITRSYLTLQWSYNGTIPGGALLGASNVRVVCANTQQMHNTAAKTLIKVKATSGAYDRVRIAAQHWAMAQDEAKALALQGERMLALKNGKQILKGLCENVLDLKVTADSSKRERTLRENKLQEVYALYHGPTNVGAVGDNGFAAFQAIVEYLDWYSPVKGDDPDTQRVANQFDGTYDNLKVRAANYVLSFAS